MNLNMSHSVYISYEYTDKAIADAICAKLEATGIPCFYAPRDICYGENESEQIAGAIEAAKIMILVFTKASNNSDRIIREVSYAVNKGLTIIPFRTEVLNPSGDLNYYLKTLHWLDAADADLNRSIEALSRSVRFNLKTGRTEIKKYRRKKIRTAARIALTALILLFAAVCIADSEITTGTVTESDCDMVYMVRSVFEDRYRETLIRSGNYDLADGNNEDGSLNIVTDAGSILFKVYVSKENRTEAGDEDYFYTVSAVNDGGCQTSSGDECADCLKALLEVMFPTKSETEISTLTEEAIAAGSRGKEITIGAYRLFIKNKDSGTENCRFEISDSRYD